MFIIKSRSYKSGQHRQRSLGGTLLHSNESSSGRSWALTLSESALVRAAWTCLLVALLISAHVASPFPHQAVAQSSGEQEGFRIGYNMDYPGDWTNQPPFIDEMKNSRAIEGSCSSADPRCDPHSHLDLDASGWLKSLRYRDDRSRSYSAGIIILQSSTARSDIGQDFVVTWTGSATLAVEGASVSGSSSSRRLAFKLGSGVTFLRITGINEADPPRNIRVFRRDFEAALNAGEVFNPELLKWLKPFKVLRFMDWMQSNSPGECSGGTRHGQDCYATTNEDCGGGVCLMPGHWAQRPTSDQRSWISWGQYLDNTQPGKGTRVGGYPLEMLVALANRAGVSPHFNIPADFDEDYVRRFGAYVRDNLRRDVKVDVEYSNEVWNWGFPQAQYANQRGRALWPNEGSAWVQYAAMRTNTLCRLLKDVFQGQTDRLNCLISPQTGWRELARTVLDCPNVRTADPTVRNCTSYVDAINISGYFSGCLYDDASKLAETTILSWLPPGTPGTAAYNALYAVALNTGYQQLLHGGLIPGCKEHLDEAMSRYKFFGDLAKERGLELQVYEGGTHFSYSGQNQRVRQFLVDLARDPRIYNAYRQNFQSFANAGGQRFNLWGWIAPNDAWANADQLTDVNHPKYRAASDFARLTAAAPAVPLRFGAHLAFE
jgi:hypothetical protein